MIVLARASALHALDRAEALLAIAAREGALDARLAPDQWDFTEQIVCAAGFACRAVLPLLGRDCPEPDWDDPAATIAVTRALLDAATGDPVARVRHRAGQADLDQSAEEYLTLFALPNLWFQLAVAHASLRARGIPVGKADFDGLHRY